MKINTFNRSLVIFLMAVVILPLVSSSLGTFKQSECVNIKTILNSTYVNISTISYPNSTIIVSNKDMTKSGLSFNYTLCDTNSFGTYIYDYFDDKGNVYVNNFNINGIGSEITQAQSILYLILLAGLFIVLIFTIWGAIIYPWRNPRNDDEEIIGINDLKYLKIVLWVFVYLEVMFFMMILRNISGGYLIGEGTYTFFNIVYTFLLIGLLPFFPLLIFYTIIIWISDKKTLKAITRGLPIK